MYSGIKELEIISIGYYFLNQPWHLKKNITAQKSSVKCQNVEKMERGRGLILISYFFFICYIFQKNVKTMH